MPRKFLPKLFVGLCCIILNACVAAWGDTYNIEAQDSSSILIKYDPSLTGINHIQSVAQNHCSQYNKVAVPQQITTSGWAITTAFFGCEGASPYAAAATANAINSQEASDNRIKAFAIQSTIDGIGAIGNAYTASGNAYGAAAATTQSGIDMENQFIRQQQQEQQDEQQRQQMQAQQEQIQQLQNEQNRLNARSPAEKLLDCGQAHDCTGVFAIGQ